MSIQTEIDRIKLAKNNIKQAIIDKGVQVDDTDKIDVYASKVAEIESGGGDISEYFNTEELSDGIKISSVILKVPELNTSKLTNMNSFFYDMNNLGEIPLIDTSNVTNMGKTFSYCTSIKSIPELNTSNVTNMSNMFDDCSSLKNIPLLNTKKVTNMSYMFQGCVNLEEIPSINTSNVTNMRNMFNGCYRIKKIPLLDMSNVTNISNAFLQCTELTTLNIKYLGKACPTSTSANNSNYTLNLSQCTKLTRDSLLNIINGLYDIKSQGCNNQSLKLGNDNLLKLTSQEIDVATQKGWNVT